MLKKLPLMSLMRETLLSGPSNSVQSETDEAAALRGPSLSAQVINVESFLCVFSSPWKKAGTEYKTNTQTSYATLRPEL